MAQFDLEEPRAAAAVRASIGERPTRVRYIVLALTSALAIVTYLHRVGFQSISTELLRDLRMDVRHLSYLTASFMVAYGLFEVPWGRLGDRFGGRNLLAIIVLGGSMMTAGVAAVVLLPASLTWQLSFLLLVRFLFGLFQAGTFPVLSRVMADWMPTTERGLAQGVIWMSTRAGGALAPLVIVPLFKQLGNWRWPLAVGAAIGVLWCLVFWPWFRNRPAELASVNESELELIASGRPVNAGGSHAAAPWGRMLRSGNVWALCGMYGFLGYSGNFFLFLLANYLEQQRHIPKDTVKWMTALPFACGVVTCVVGGWLSDEIIKRSSDKRWGRRLVGSFGLGLGAIAILMTPWANGVGMLALVLAVAFAGNDLAMGPAWAAASDIGERHAGTLAGTMNMTASFTAAIAALLTGQLLHDGHTTLPFLLFAASYAGGSLCWLRVDVTETLVESASDVPAR